MKAFNMQFNSIDSYLWKFKIDNEMFLKKLFFLITLIISFSVFTSEEKANKPIMIETIKFKELTEFDACFLIYRAPVSFNIKDMLRDYMKFREFECTKYDEILKRATIIRGSFPKNSIAYQATKRK